MTKLGAINSLSDTAARTAFLPCCGSTRWAERMAGRRPFSGEEELLAASAEIWQDLARADWLEAFAAHPRIGDLDALRGKFARSAPWSAQEQGGVAGAADAVLQALADGNQRYEAKFGHLFIVCATGKSAEEMLALLEQRLRNEPDQELRIAAAEQQKITRLRLQGLGP